MSVLQHNQNQERSDDLRPRKGDVSEGVLLIDAARNHVEADAREEDQTADSDCVAIVYVGQFVKVGARLPVHRDLGHPREHSKCRVGWNAETKGGRASRGGSRQA